jgi:hypothetical protein
MGWCARALGRSRAVRSSAHFSHVTAPRGRHDSCYALMLFRPVPSAAGRITQSKTTAGGISGTADERERPERGKNSYCDEETQPTNRPRPPSPSRHGRPTYQRDTATALRPNNATRPTSIETSTGRNLSVTVREPSPELGRSVLVQLVVVGRGMQSLRGAQRECAGPRSRRVAGDTEELEEGEACSDADGEAFVDPDVAFSYIVSTPGLAAWHPPSSFNSAAGFLCR